MSGDRDCYACGKITEADHNSSERHRFNFLLFEWNHYRKSIVKNRAGIIIEQRIINSDIQEEQCFFIKNKGVLIIKLSSKDHGFLQNGITCSFTIINERRDDKICLMKALHLHPHYDDTVKFSDNFDIIQNQNVLELQPKQKYEINVSVKFKETAVGSYKIPLAFCFQVHGATETDSHTFARQLLIVISDHEDVVEDAEKSPFKAGGVWKNIQVIIPPVVQPFVSEYFPIPPKYYKVLMSGLRDNQYLSYNDQYHLNYIRNVFDPSFVTTGEFECQFPTPENYKDFFHFLVWLDEIGQALMLQRYNMSNVTMKVLPNDMLELTVPGLAEKRPSLIPGDLVKIRLHEDHTVYKGVVKTINDKTIWIHQIHTELIEYIREYEDVELDVAFELGRLPYERKHRGIDDCVGRGLWNILFPQSFLSNRSLGTNYKISDDKFCNQSILDNNEQKTAVLNILNCTSQYAPYIVFGPPGTGKTITIVEAILQIKLNFRKAKILVCAPANAACDMLTSKLLPFCTKKELIRVHTASRNWNDVPNDIKPYSNYDQTYKKITPQELATFRIVVTTLVYIGKYSGSYSPDYVFIDEAAQAMEPEADIAIGLMTQGKQLILAGDPKQLGPQCSSKVAAEFKLEVSLLERLMSTNILYQQDNAKNFITMLKRNYRSHPSVLQVPNELFYENQLLAVNPKPLNDPIAKVFVYPRTLVGRQNDIVPGEAVEFCAVFAKEQRQGKSPSYYNESEIQTTMKCIHALISMRQTRVCQSDIGIVTPYIRQVHRLKQRLQQCDLNDIEVGTTEVFQGREKRIMIVTTVRAQHSLLLYDKKYNLGFVSNDKRFNVALTRAMSKLIVIGNPIVLATNENWLRYIEFCEEKNAYFGKKYTRRNASVRNDIKQRISSVTDTTNRDKKAAQKNTNNKGKKKQNRRK